MDPNGKSVIFNLLKTASRYFEGYTKPQFMEEPDFSMENPAVATENPVSEANAALAQTPAVPKENQVSQTSEVSTESPSSVSENAIVPPVQEPAVSSGMTLEAVYQKIERCTRCPLARTRTNVVPGVGAAKPMVIVLGEAPGADEDRTGIPFVGPAGQLLDRMLGAIRLSRDTNTYIMNTVKCRPPENRNPAPEEMDACQGFMEAQIKLLKPKMILCVGKVAAQKLLDSDQTIGKLRNQFFKYQDIPVLVTYHPSAVLRNEGLKGPVWEDLKLFGNELKKVCPEYAALFGE